MDARSAPLTLIERARQDLPNFFSLLVFFFTTALLFRSWEFALTITASLGFHELGHAAALSWLGLEWRIAFGFVGAWTWSDAGQREQLSEIANVFVHISGPFFSLVLAVAALALNILAFPGDHHLLTLTNFSAQVGFLNLLPLSTVSDGGKIVRRIITSVDGKHRQRAILLPLVVAVVMLILYTWVQLPNVHVDTSPHFVIGLLLIGIWMASSMLLEARFMERRSGRQKSLLGRNAALVPDPIPVTGQAEKIDTGDRTIHPRPMTIRQVFLLTILLWDMLAVYLVIITRTPFWLEPNYVEGSLKNVMVLLNWLAKLI